MVDAATGSGLAGTSAFGFLQSVTGTFRLRHMRVAPGWCTDWRSTVLEGTVQAKYTLSPLRAARRSLTGLASSSEGGIGTPGAPQETYAAQLNTQSRMFQSDRFIVRTNRLTEGQEFLRVWWVG